MVTETCLTDPKLCAKQDPGIAGDQSSSSAALTIVSTSVLCLSGHGESPLELKTCSWPDKYVRSQQGRQFTSWFLVCVCISFSMLTHFFRTAYRLVRSLRSHHIKLLSVSSISWVVKKKKGKKILLVVSMLAQKHCSHCTVFSEGHIFTEIQASCSVDIQILQN